MKGYVPNLSTPYPNAMPFLYVFHGQVRVCMPDEKPPIRVSRVCDSLFDYCVRDIPDHYQTHGVLPPEAVMSSKSSVFSKVNLDLIMAMLPRSWQCSKATIG
jgi:hypothetical protein